MLHLDGKTRISQSKEFPISTGEVVAAEGVALMQVLEDGEECVKPTTAAGTEVFIGFSYGQTMTPVTKSNVEELTCPAVALYTVTLEKEPIAAQIYIVNSAGTEQTSGDPANANEYSIVAKVVTFHAGQAGLVETITYRYSPTAVELQFEDKLDLTSFAATDYVSSIGAILQGEIFTDQFDAGVAWAGGAVVKCGASGIVTIGGAGATISCVVTHVPTVETPFLGLRY